MSLVNIKDGSTGFVAGVDANKALHTYAVDINAVQWATGKGNSYNINTGEIALTSTTASGVLYFKNNESPVNGESTFIIDAIAVGIKSGTTSAMSEIKIIANPTTGTLISGATPVSMKANRNLGSSNTLDSLIYKGTEGSTVTNGTDWGYFYQSAGSRGYYSIDMEVPKGSSMAVTIDTNTTSGTTYVYVALIGHRKDGNFKL